MLCHLKMQTQQQSRLAVESILARRQQAPVVSTEGIRETRENGSP